MPQSEEPIENAQIIAPPQAAVVTDIDSTMKEVGRKLLKD